MMMQRYGWMALGLVALAGLSACGGAEQVEEERLACIDPDDPRARDPALRDELEICPDIRGPVGMSVPREPEEAVCEALDVGAWQVSIRYSGEIGATAPNGRRVVEHQVTAELGALVTMQRRASSAGENWSPSGKVMHQMREYFDGELVMSAVGEGAPVPGNATVMSDSRILLSIDPSSCTYNLHSNGTVMSQVTRDGDTETIPAGYGAVYIRSQPASLEMSGSQRIPVVEESFEPSVDMPLLYIPSIGAQEGGGVQVTWEINPVR